MSYVVETAKEWQAVTDARHLIRDIQKTLCSGEGWHTLADTLNYLDARRDSIASTFPQPEN